MVKRKYFLHLSILLILSNLNNINCVQESAELENSNLLPENNENVIEQNSIQLQKTKDQLNQELSLLEKDRTTREDTINFIKEKAKINKQNQEKSEYLQKASDQLKRLEEARIKLEEEMSIAVKLAEEAEKSGEQLMKVEQKIEKEEKKIEESESNVEREESQFQDSLDEIQNQVRDSEENEEIKQIAQGFETLAVSSDQQNKDVKKAIKKNQKGRKKLKEVNMNAESHLYQNPDTLLKINENSQLEENNNLQQQIEEQNKQKIETEDIENKEEKQEEENSQKQSQQQQQQQEQKEKQILQENEEDETNLLLGREICEQINIRRIKSEQNQLKWNDNLAFLAYLLSANIKQNSSKINEFQELEIIDNAINSYDNQGYVAQLIALVPENNPTLLAMDAWEKDQKELLDDDYSYCAAYYKTNPEKELEFYAVVLLIQSTDVNKQNLQQFAESDEQFQHFEEKVKTDSEYEFMVNKFKNN